MIVNWLKAERDRALAAVKKQACASKEQTCDEIWKKVKMSEKAAQLQEAVDRFSDMAKEFERTLEALDGVSLRPYRLLSGEVYTLSKNMTGVKDFITSQLIDSENSSRFQKIRRQRRDLESGVNANYTTIIENVKNMKDAKVAMEYLKSLGFDLTALKKLDDPVEVITLALPVDTRFLFLQNKV